MGICRVGILWLSAGRMCVCVGIRKQSVVGYLLVVSGLAGLKSSPFQNDLINPHSSLSLSLPYSHVTQFVRFVIAMFTNMLS